LKTQDHLPSAFVISIIPQGGSKQEIFSHFINTDKRATASLSRLTELPGGLGEQGKIRRCFALDSIQKYQGKN
jgi:hypothetical protein